MVFYTFCFDFPSLWGQSPCLDAGREKDTNKVIGVGVLGTNAGELISEVSLAIEMGCEAEDIALTVHPHPTLSETVAMATEVCDGTITDM